LSSSNFTKIIEFVLLWEGGFVNHPADPGGATNLGITQRTYDNWRRKKGLPLQSVEFMKKPEALEIYKEEYWDKAGCEGLDFPLACCQMDACVNTGVSRANKFLDGCNGDYKLYLELRNTFYLDLIKRRPNMKVFQKGWLRRTGDLRKFIDVVLMQLKDSL